MHRCDAATESWAKRPISLIFFFGMNSSGAKRFTSPAKRVGKSCASKRVMSAIPLSPASTARQVASVPMPLGVTSPIPVMTTRSIS